jgi:hypothetical protein
MICAIAVRNATADASLPRRLISVLAAPVLVCPHPETRVKRAWAVGAMLPAAFPCIAYPSADATPKSWVMAD